jgi:hypothetical protein
MPYSPLEVAKNIDGVGYQYVFDGSIDGTSGNYTVSGLGGRVYVGTNINVTLRVTANASPSTIRVAGKGLNAGKLTIYMDAPTFSLSGSSSVDGGNATNLTYYGTTNNTQISFGGNASFTGTIYAPQADFKLGGGGPDPYDFVGSSVTKSVQMNGHYKFHFDENLLKDGPKTGFIANSWREL